MSSTWPSAQQRWPRPGHHPTPAARTNFLASWGPWGLGFKVLGFQGFRVVGFQGFRVLGFRVLGF